MAAPTPNCAVNLSNLLPSCAARRSVAGVAPFGYFCRRVDITGYTKAADGTVTGVTLPANKLKKFQTAKFQNSGEWGVAASAIGKPRFAQTFNWRILYRDQADRNAMEALILAEDIVVFVPNNDNQVEIYGQQLGLTATTVKGGTGAKLDDDNTALLTFTGSEPSLPALFNTATVTATSTTATTTSTALAVVSATGILAGQTITGSGIPAGTTVVSVSSNTLTLSAVASVPAATPLTLTSADEQAYAANIAYLDNLVG